MDSSSYISLINLGFYAIYSFFFSVYIIPLLRNVRELKNELYGFNFPYLKSGVDLNREQSKKVREYIRLVNRYESEYEDLKKLINLLYVGVLVIAIGLFLVFLAKFSFIPWIIPLEYIFLWAVTVILICLMISGYRLYIPSVYKLSDMEYLIKKQGISPRNLINCSDISLSIGVDQKIGESFKVNMPKKISLHTQFPLIGYRYLLCVFQGDNLFYKCYSVVDKNTTIRKINLEYLDQDFDYLAHHFDIGEFVYTGDEIEFTFYLFVFDPCIERDTINYPLYTSDTETIAGNTIGSSLNCKVNHMQTFTPIQYNGKGTKFNKIEWHDLNRYPISNEHATILKKLIESEGKKICKTSKTKT